MPLKYALKTTTLLRGSMKVSSAYNVHEKVSPLYDVSMEFLELSGISG